MLIFFVVPFLAFCAELKLSDAEWKEQLGEKRYRVMRCKAREPGFSGAYLDEERVGTYVCAACGKVLFQSEDKYSEPGCGWPVFKKPIDSTSVLYLEDRTLGFKRYEVKCRGCESHLGHVFHDGPPPKHLRYTINSIALLFIVKNP